MKKSLIIAAAFALVLLLAACRQNTPAATTPFVKPTPANVATPTPAPTPAPTPVTIADPSDVSAFDFTFYFGVDSKNIMSTEVDIFKKDMVSVDPVTTTLKFTDDEMRQILAKMIEIDLFMYPSSFKDVVGTGLTSIVEPHQTYRFDIKYKDITKSVWWSDDHNSKSEKAVKLRELIKLIEDLIYAKPEYKALPPAVGGYA